MNVYCLYTSSKYTSGEGGRDKTLFVLLSLAIFPNRKHQLALV